MGKTTTTVLSKRLSKQLHDLWENRNFRGSFTGVESFRKALREEKGLDIPYNVLMKLMLRNANFVKTIRPQRRFPRRHLTVHGFLTVVQADLAVMPSNYFTLAIDAFSRRIFCRAQTAKTADATRKSLESIFEEMGDTPISLETDDGGEFRGNKLWLTQTKKVYWKVKYGRNKAFLAERAIHRIKTVLFRMCRVEMDDEWEKFLPVVVQHYNDTPLKAIGGVKPGDIKSPLDDPLIDEKMSSPKLPSPKEMDAQQRAYEADDKKLQVGQYVFADAKESLFDKSFEIKREQVFKITRILAEEKPVLYYLENLKGTPMQRAFYKSELRATRKPGESDVYPIEKVIATRVRKGKKESLVKFRGYPAVHNEWIETSTIREKKKV